MVFGFVTLETDDTKMLLYRMGTNLVKAVVKRGKVVVG